MNADKNDSNTTIAEIKAAIDAYRNERGWTNLSPRDLAISITLEAAELLEHFQWNDSFERKLTVNREEIMNEFGDVLNYLLQFAMTLDFDVTTAWREKLELVKAKYPTTIFNPSNRDDFETYQQIKRSHRGAKSNASSKAEETNE